MSIDVFGIANAAIQAVNEDIPAIWRRSNGYLIDDAGIQIPQYIDTAIKVQSQAVSGDALAFTDGLDIQGVMRSVYMYGNVQGVVRSDERGGDLLMFPQIPGNPNQTWKVVTVVETWPGWAHVIVVLQTDETTQ